MNNYSPNYYLPSILQIQFLRKYTFAIREKKKKKRIITNSRLTTRLILLIGIKISEARLYLGGLVVTNDDGSVPLRGALGSINFDPEAD